MTRRPTIFSLPLLLAGALLHAQAPAPQATTPQTTATQMPATQMPAGKPSTPAVIQCAVDHTAPAEADLLLAGEHYKEADVAYRQQLTREPGQPDAFLGVVRALLGQDNVAEAQAEAAGFLARQPNIALAEVAVAEASYRAANIGQAFAHAKSALLLNPCEVRSALALARLYDLTGLYAESAKEKAQAHRIRPEDQLITRVWLQSLPRAQRQKELSLFLEKQPALSQRRMLGYQNELKHLEARKPGECHISSKTEETQTGMKPIYGDHSRPVAYGLDVSFEGKRRRMQIDTGASGILLTEAAARGLGLQPEFPLKAGGIGDEGERDSYLSHVHSIRIGDVEVENCMVEVIAKSKLDVDGLIGMEVFDRWLVTMDYQAAQLRLSPLPARPGSRQALGAGGVAVDEDEFSGSRNRYVAPEMKDWLPIARIGHEILLPAMLKQGAPVHYMIMDTGAQTSSFSIPLASETGKLHTSSVQIVGLSGKMKHVFETDDTGLIVGSLSLAPEQYFAYDLSSISHNSGFEVSGLLGLPTLQRLTIQIDYRDNLLKLSYDPKHDQQRF